jgi:hypothetical protein
VNKKEIEKAISHLTMLQKLDSGEKKNIYDTAISALEKQIPKKPEISSYGIAFCPICCGSVWQNRDESDFCFRCDTAIDWSDNVC